MTWLRYCVTRSRFCMTRLRGCSVVTALCDTAALLYATVTALCDTITALHDTVTLLWPDHGFVWHGHAVVPWSPLCEPRSQRRCVTVTVFVARLQGCYCNTVLLHINVMSLYRKTNRFKMRRQDRVLRWNKEVLSSGIRMLAVLDYGSNIFFFLFVINK